VGPRVLFVGDSFTEGVGLPWEKTFVGKVQTSLAPSGVEVLNAGVNSYCPLLIKHRLRELIEKQGLELDRVVVLIDISDVLQELQYRETLDGSVEAIPYAPFEREAKTLDRANRIQDWLEKNIEDRFVLLGALSRNLRLW
jgi:lysophospholipase L1-like esterase